MNKQLLEEQVKSFVTQTYPTLEEWVKALIRADGGRNVVGSDVQIYDIHNFQGFSGYNFWVEGILVGQLQIATLLASGFVIYRRLFVNGLITESYEYFNQEGQFVYTGNTMDGGTYSYSSINMDPTNPVVNHLYNILNAEYDQTLSGYSRTRLIFTVEQLLRNVFDDKETPISINRLGRDAALGNIYNEINRTELDPVLTWDERQAIYKNLRFIRSKIVRTKKRVHHPSPFTYDLPILLFDIKNKLQIIKTRPSDNLGGMFYQLTLGNLIWFLKTVRANLGLSIAMAIYTPFTFYFITQPMNPHAMQVVGEIRSAFLNVSKEVQSWFEFDKDLVKVANADTTVTDEVSTQVSANAADLALPTNQKISWEQRMGNFKAMQINYESNLIFAARIGRIEHFENQFIFPLTAESAWNEITYYENEVSATLKWNPNLSSNYRDFLNAELDKIAKAKIYIWQKMAQFFLDHPYMVVDQDNEQTIKDYYIGRCFVFMKKMTQQLMGTHANMAPTTHPKVMELAQVFENKKVSGINVLDTLKKNSVVYGQKDEYDSDELRKKVGRHWEVLFLLQNKAQEASVFGLQIYTVSVRNALYALQTIYSAKREELGSMTFKFNLNNTNTAAIRASDTASETYEHMLNLLTTEYTSFSKELATLKDDTEAQLRMEIINTLKASIEQRDQLFGINQVARN